MRIDSSLAPIAFAHDAEWAIREINGIQLWQQVKGMDADVHRAQFEASEARYRAQEDRPYELSDGIAYFSLSGVMTKAPTSWDSGTSTSRMRRAIRLASNDEDVKAILIKIDSPGGSVAGTKELADDVAAAAKQKTVYGYIEDLGCSAAYWVGSQCSKLYANATAIVGSIGTLLVLYDYSAMTEEAGIECLVFATGELKGAGAFGSKVTPAQRDKFQALVNDLNSHFLAGVARGRKLPKSKVKDLADGGTHVGQAAADLGLIDEIASWEDVVNRLRTKTRGAKAEHELSASDPLSGIQLEDELDAALSAVQGANTRLTDVSEWRVEHNRPPLSPARLEQAKSLHAQLGGMIEACEPPSQEEPTPEPEGQPESEQSDTGLSEQALMERTLALRTAQLGKCR